MNKEQLNLIHSHMNYVDMNIGRIMNLQALTFNDEHLK